MSRSKRSKWSIGLCADPCKLNADKDFSRDFAARIGLPPAHQDEKTVTERKWLPGLKPAKPQKACDHGLFSDDMDQVEMFMDPTNEA